MELEIDGAQRKLTHLCPATHEASRRHQSFVEIVRERFTGLMVFREEIQSLALPCPVFHELAGKLNPVPRHVDAGARGDRYA